MLKCCCFVFAIILAVNTLLAGVAAIVAYRWTEQQVVRLTVLVEEEQDRPPSTFDDDATTTFPIVEMSRDEIHAIQDRYTAFVNNILAAAAAAADGEQEQQAAQPTVTAVDDLILSAHECNGLLHGDLVFGSFFRGNVHVDIQPGVFTVQMSLPVTYLPGGHGRFFVANYTIRNDDVSRPQRVVKVLDAADALELDFSIFKFEMDISQDETTGKWTAVLESFGFMGSYVYAPTEPECKHLKQNILDWVDDDHVLDRILNGIASITMEKDQIVFRAKKNNNVCANNELPVLDNTTTILDYNKRTVYTLSGSKVE